MKLCSERLPGYRELGKILERHEKAIRFQYYNWKIWIPISALRKVIKGSYIAPQWAIDTAKAHPSSETSPTSILARAIQQSEKGEP